MQVRPKPKLISHAWLIEKLKALQYPLKKQDDAGVCFGYAVMDMLYRLSNHQEQFDFLIKFIKESDVETLEFGIKLALQKEENQQELNEQDIIYLYSHKILSWIVSFQGPEFINPDCHQRDVEKIFPNNINQLIYKCEASELKKVSTVQYTFSGAYTKDELAELLEMLQSKIMEKNISCPVGFMIRGSGHAINIVFDPKKIGWHVGNADFEVAIEDNHCLNIAEIINVSIMNHLPYTIFSTQIFANSAAIDEIRNCIDGLLRLEAWEKIHAVTPEKATFMVPANRRQSLQSWLLVALFMRQENILKKLLAEGANPNLNMAGNSLLFTAINELASLSIIEILLQGGANPNIDDEFAFNKRPLCKALEQQNIPLIQLICSSPLIVQKELNIGLYFACVYVKENTDIITTLLSFNALPNIKTTSGETLLHHAVINNKELNTSILLTVCPVNALNDSYETPLHKAIKVGSLALIEILLTHGANVFFDSAQKQMMHLAKLEDEESYSEESFDEDEIEQPIALAASLGQIDIMIRLIQAGSPCSDEVISTLRKSGHATEGDIMKVKQAIKEYRLSEIPNEYAESQHLVFNQKESPSGASNYKKPALGK